MSVAEMFFVKLLEPNATVDEALRHVRLSFLAEGNLLGLAYTPYCFADLAIAIDPPGLTRDADAPQGTTTTVGP